MEIGETKEIICPTRGFMGEIVRESKNNYSIRDWKGGWLGLEPTYGDAIYILGKWFITNFGVYGRPK